MFIAIILLCVLGYFLIKGWYNVFDTAHTAIVGTRQREINQLKRDYNNRLKELKKERTQALYYVNPKTSNYLDRVDEINKQFDHKEKLLLDGLNAILKN